MKKNRSETPQINRVALYARVSTKDGRQDTENQLLPLREFCYHHNWRIVHEYVDHETGGTAKRKQFQAMFEAARMREFDLVLFWSLDRLSREGVPETLGHLQRLTSYGVQWKSHTEPYLDSCGIFRDAVLAILATIAKQERTRRSERASAAIARLRKQGKPIGRKEKVFDRHEMVKLHTIDGVSIRKLAVRFKVSPMTVQRALKAAKAA